MTLPTTGAAATAAVVEPAGGVRGWFGALSPRDRAIYVMMLLMLAAIVAVFLFIGVQSLAGGTATAPTTAPTDAAPTSAAVLATDRPTDTPTGVPATPTDLPTHAPTVAPTATPTREPVIIPPTLRPTGLPTATPTPVQAESPTTTRQPTRQPTPTVQATLPAATATVAATSTAAPTARPTSTPTPAPTEPPGEVTSELVTLYFADATDTLYVPVQRTVQVTNGMVATAAVQSLIAGPPSGLRRLVPADVQLLDLTIDAGTATLDFDRRPSPAGDERGYYAIMYTLIEFPTIAQVRFQINGQPIMVGGSETLGWRPINPINPQQLPIDFATTSFLPVYFVSKDGAYDIRMIHMVPKTLQTAEATMRALLEGPGPYADAVQRSIPAGTQLRGIRLDQGTIIVDLTYQFSEAADRDDAIRTLVASLTTLPAVEGVQVLVEGRSLAEWWGDAFGGVLSRPPINRV